MPRVFVKKHNNVMPHQARKYIDVMLLPYLASILCYAEPNKKGKVGA